MKAFDEWRNHGCIDGVNWTDDKRDKEVWKAALKWVLSLGDNEEPYTWENIINYKIREELDG